MLQQLTKTWCSCAIGGIKTCVTRYSHNLKYANPKYDKSKFMSLPLHSDQLVCYHNISVYIRKGLWWVYRPSSHNPQDVFFAIEPSSVYMNVRVESPFKCTRKGKVVNKIFNHCNRNPDFTSERTKQSETNFKAPTECFSVTARKSTGNQATWNIWIYMNFFLLFQYAAKDTGLLHLYIPMTAGWVKASCVW